MHLFKPNALALDAVVQPLSTGGYQYRWSITVAYTYHCHRIRLLPEHHVIDFLRKQHVPCVLEHVPFVVRCVMQQKTLTLLNTEKIASWHYSDIELSLIRFHVTDCCFDEITFDQHTLRHIIFERCAFRRTQFTNCQCLGVHWQHCDFAFVRWQKVNAAQAYFVHNTMRQCTFHDTMLFNSKADHCRFIGVDLHHAAWHTLIALYL